VIETQCPGIPPKTALNMRGCCGATAASDTMRRGNGCTRNRVSMDGSAAGTPRIFLTLKMRAAAESRAQAKLEWGTLEKWDLGVL
jgi:hypothetical protein